MIRNYIIFALLGYFSGNIMFAYLITKYICGKDLTSVSDDGNPGVANAFKYGSIYAGIPAVILELGKGFLPVYLSLKFVSPQPVYFILVLTAPVIGHAFPVMFKKGGKSIAVTFGCLLGLFPDLNPALLLAMFYIFFSLIVTVSPNVYKSIVTFSCFCVTAIFLIKLPSVVISCFIMSAIVIYKHCIMHKNHLPEAKIRLFNRK